MDNKLKELPTCLGKVKFWAAMSLHNSFNDPVCVSLLEG